MARSSRRLAVVGASGQLGSDLVRCGRESGYEVVSLTHDDVEVTDARSIEAALEAATAEVVIDCAAFHQVDECERDPATAFAVNSIGAASIARAARRRGARTVFVSTDYVFSGTKPFSGPTGPASPVDAYTEDEPTGPVNAYGVSKLAGEMLVRQADDGALIVRTAGLFGRTGSRGKKGTNFVEQVLRQVRIGAPLRVVDDQYVTPTYTLDAAQAIIALIDLGATGIVHVAAAGACTWHEFASRCVAQVEARLEVERIGAAERSAGAARPANTALCVDRLASLLRRPVRPWTEALAAYLSEMGHV
ncbi:MAG: dTDP-4-dehydrorhamnose reductase [Chloroflexi bacterium]|nr:dTDP-4-dehydrorhamnose reductase [Chloroflexota bacterium]